MDLAEMRAFLCVVESGSFLAAATQLQLARTTLRRRVDTLEARVGAPLLRRRSEGIVLTEAGELLVEHARGILADTDAVLAQLRDLHTGQAQGRLRLMWSSAVPPSMLRAIIGMLNGAMPEVQLEAQTAADPFQTALMGADVVGHFSHNAPPPGWSSSQVHAAPERVLASVSYCERHGVPRTIADLAEHDVWGWRHPRVGPLLQLPPSAPGAPPKKRILVNDIDTLRRVLCEGSAVVLLPDAEIIEPEYPDERVYRLLPEIERACAFHISTPASPRRSRKVETVLEQLLSLASHLPRRSRLAPPPPTP